MSRVHVSAVSRALDPDEEMIIKRNDVADSWANGFAVGENNDSSGARRFIGLYARAIDAVGAAEATPWTSCDWAPAPRSARVAAR